MYDNSLVFYDNNELKAGEIFIDWNKNMLEARKKDSVYPSINGFGESPIFGEKMEFDLISKKGKIIKGETNFNQSFYNGETLTKDQNELFYINNSIFTHLSKLLCCKLRCQNDIFSFQFPFCSSTSL